MAIVRRGIDWGAVVGAGVSGYRDEQERRRQLALQKEARDIAAAERLRAQALQDRSFAAQEEERAYRIAERNRETAERTTADQYLEGYTPPGKDRPLGPGAGALMRSLPAGVVDDFMGLAPQRRWQPGSLEEAVLYAGQTAGARAEHRAPPRERQPPAPQIIQTPDGYMQVDRSTGTASPVRVQGGGVARPVPRSQGGGATRKPVGEVFRAEVNAALGKAASAQSGVAGVPVTWENVNPDAFLRQYMAQIESVKGYDPHRYSQLQSMGNQYYNRLKAQRSQRNRKP